MRLSQAPDLIEESAEAGGSASGCQAQDALLEARRQFRLGYESSERYVFQRSRGVVAYEHYGAALRCLENMDETSLARLVEEKSSDMAARIRGDFAAIALRAEVMLRAGRALEAESALRETLRFLERIPEHPFTQDVVRQLATLTSRRESK